MDTNTPAHGNGDTQGPFVTSPFDLAMKDYASARNENARKSTLEKFIAIGTDQASQFLCSLLSDESEPTFIRKEAARLLPSLNNAHAIRALGAVIGQSDDNGLVQQAITSLGEIASKEAFSALFGNLGTRNKNCKARLLDVMAKLAVHLDPASVDSTKAKFEEIAANDTEHHVRKSALNALAALPGDHAPFLLRRFDIETADGIRHRILRLLATSNTPIALAHLIKVCATADRQTMRESARTELARFDAIRCQEAAIRFVCTANWNGALYARELCTAVAGDNEVNWARLAEATIQAAVGASGRVVSTLATILIESCGGSREKAGERINVASAADAENRAKYDAIRIAVGGNESLEPILEQLKKNLDENFSKPVADLNKRTIKSWELTVLCVQIGFIIKLTMSSLVFLIGMCLTIWSVIQFSEQRSSAESLWGPGASLAAGMASMLFIAYSGPIKDIQNSVDAIGRANAIFIGFVHSIMQSSHIFSMRYLKGDLQISDVVEINKLVQRSMNSAVIALEANQLALKSRKADSAFHDDQPE